MVDYFFPYIRAFATIGSSTVKRVLAAFSMSQSLFAAQPRTAALDNNVLAECMDSAGVTPTRLARRFAELGLNIVIPEIAIVQLLAHGNDERCYRRFARLAEFMDVAGHEHARLGAPFSFTMNEEFASRLPLAPPTYSAPAQESIFANADSAELFRDFLAELRSDALAWLDVEGWHRADTDVQSLAERVLLQWDSHPKRTRVIGEALALVPDRLDSHHSILVELIPDRTRREMVSSEPARFPSVVCLALACDLNVLAAAANLRGDAALKHLSAEKDAWSDARLLASAVHADLLLTNDRTLTRRSAHLRDWGFAAPRLLTCAEALGSDFLSRSVSASASRRSNRTC